MPNQMAALDQLAEKHHSIFIKLEPNVTKDSRSKSQLNNPDLKFLHKLSRLKTARPSLH